MRLSETDEMRCLLSIVVCLLGCATPYKYTESDYVYIEFPHKEGIGLLTIRGNGTVHYRFNSHQDGVSLDVSFARDEIEKVFQSLVDAGLYDLPPTSTHYATSGPSGSRITAQIHHHQVDFVEQLTKKLPDDILKQFLVILHKIDRRHWP